ncbi:MAG: hypothetical protein IJQ32_06365 [Paludibacteraceae bacterium]|nr:hypothetical protein [Paludibacteraceae bacterium]
MKKIFTFFVAIMTTVSALAYEYERPGFEWSAGCDFTTAYLWRGMRWGGMSFQPDVCVGYAGLSLEAWANIGAVDNSFKEFNPELDMTLQYKAAGLTVGFTHYYYFDGTKYFGYNKPRFAYDEAGNILRNEDGEIEYKRYNTCQLEVFGKFELGEIIEILPITFLWSTYIAGDDWKVTENENDPNDVTLKRAYSSYFEVSYEAELPLGFSIIPTVGMTPWASMYNHYENKFSVNNISLKLNWEASLKEVITLDIYGIAMLNTAGINKDNVWPSIKNSYGEQRLNLAAGIGIWF